MSKNTGTDQLRRAIALNPIGLDLKLDKNKLILSTFIDPQPASCSNPGNWGHCKPYFTGQPKLGWAYYWKHDGHWNCSRPFFPKYKIGQRLWVKGTFRWFRVADVKPKRINTNEHSSVLCEGDIYRSQWGTWIWEYELEVER